MMVLLLVGRRVGSCPAGQEAVGSVALERDVVLDGLDALDRGGQFARAVHFCGGLREAAELNGALVGLDIDLQGADGLVFNEQGLHLGGDDAVIDDFAEARLRVGAGATRGQRGGTDSQKEDGGEDGCVSLHGWTPKKVLYGSQ